MRKDFEQKGATVVSVSPDGLSRASRDEMLETFGVATHMGGGPSIVYGGKALRAFDSFPHPPIPAE